MGIKAQIGTIFFSVEGAMDVEIQVLAQSVPIRARFSFIFDGVLIRLPLHQPCTLNMKTPQSPLGLVVCEDSDGLDSHISSIQLEPLEKISKKKWVWERVSGV